MKTLISLLRGVNVGGRKVLMAEIKELYLGLGFKAVRTYIQSGNVLFQVDKKTKEADVCKLLEKTLLEKYAYPIPIIIKSADELQKVIAANPFIKRENVDEKRLYVTFLADTPSPEKLENTKSFEFPPEEFEIIGNEIYLNCPTGYGESKLSNNFFENKLKVAATTRNWNSVNKLYSLSKEMEDM